MYSFKRLNLQLFAEGAGAATGTSAGTSDSGTVANTGENATAAAEQKLRELGVPEAKIRKRASIYASKMPMQTESRAASTEAPTEAKEVVSAPTNDDNPTEAKEDASKPTRMTWDEIMKDPEYNQQMQKVISSRLKTAKTAEDNLSKLAPALEMLSKKYNLDPSKMDYEALGKAIEDDDAYYEEKALEMGTTVDVAKRLETLERENKLRQQQAERTLEEQRIQQNFDKLERQGENLKKTFPKFDLKTELQNPTFARLTSPGVGLSVEDAYYTIHRNEIQTASMQVTAQMTAEKISNAMQANSRRPAELGTSAQAPSANTFDYRNATPQQREALKKRIRDAAARGEKLYPGQ